MKKAAFYTLGCKVNQYETEAMEELFSANGYELCPFTEKADIYIINTCSVTNMSDRKSRQIIRRAKKTNPNAIIAVTGCYAQTAPDEVLKIDGVNLVIGNQDKKDIVSRVEELSSDDKNNDVLDIMNAHEFEDLKITKYTDRTRAFIKIQDGCSQFCSYCMTLDAEFVRNISGCSKLCPHFHISLQSGCDETLRRMNRHYTTAQYKEVVDGLRKAFPDVAITTDIMVGFAGETDEEFNQTVQFVKEIEFSGAHIFQYSQRRGTPAAKRPNQVSPQIKEKRSAEIIAITKKSEQKFHEGFLGRTMEVLFEQTAKDGFWEGKTPNYITVYVKSSEDLQGQYRNVKLLNADSGIVYGELEV